MSERTGTQRQALVGGLDVNLETQEEFGLITLSTGCSGSLLRNRWVVTAAHCIEFTDGNGQSVPDPDRPGQNVLESLTGITVRANWPESTLGQSRSVTEAHTFRPYDIALLKLFEPISVNGHTNKYFRDIYNGGEDGVVGVRFTAFGRGLTRFAQIDATGKAVPAQGGGPYKLTYAKVASAVGELYSYQPLIGEMAGGDSGGPSLVYSNNRYKLLGVHSSAQQVCLPGYQCGDWPAGNGPVPPGYRSWQWVSATTSANDAPIVPVWAQISPLIGPPPTSETVPELAPGYIGVFDFTPKMAPQYIYGVEDNGTLHWYRTGADAKGPLEVGNGWNAYRDVVPAGGNRYYALAGDGRLLWFQHQGIADGKWTWAPPSEVGHGWAFSKIFGGGDGIVYAVTPEGKLLWYQHLDWRGGTPGWAPWKEVSTGGGWDQFVTLHGGGQGVIFGVRTDGSLMRYVHKGHADGSPSWERPVKVATGWGEYPHIVALGQDQLLSVDRQGYAAWHAYTGTSLARQRPDEVTIDRDVHHWLGPRNMGGGFHFAQMFGALAEGSTAPVR